MKLSPDLKFHTSAEWTSVVLGDFNSFLQDHADCERKASAMAMSFVAKCPDKVKIIPELIETALEELQHFQMVYKIMEERGIQLRQEMKPDPYIRQFLDCSRTSPEERLLDRFLMASIIECRGTERFRMVEEALDEGALKRFYKMLWASEAKHANIFIKMALEYYPEGDVFSRLEKLNDQEGKICAALPLKAALH